MYWDRQASASGRVPEPIGIVAEDGVVEPAGGAFRELRAALAQWQARESEAGAE